MVEPDAAGDERPDLVLEPRGDHLVDPHVDPPAEVVRVAGEADDDRVRHAPPLGLQFGQWPPGVSEHLERPDDAPPRAQAGTVVPAR